MVDSLNDMRAGGKARASIEHSARTEIAASSAIQEAGKDLLFQGIQQLAKVGVTHSVCLSTLIAEELFGYAYSSKRLMPDNVGLSDEEFAALLSNTVIIQELQLLGS